MKRLAAILFLLSAFAFGQAGTPTTFKEWYALNEASDIHSSDLACYSPPQVNFADHNTTITMASAGAPFSCGGNNGTPFSTSQSYISGSIMWRVINFKPTAGHPITIEVKMKCGVGWCSAWMLGANCQGTSPFSWDNFGTCNWPFDTSKSAEFDIMETRSWVSTTSVSHNKFVNGNSVSCSQDVSNFTTNAHLYHTDWATSAINMKIDGTDANCGYTSNIPQNEMFLIIENRQQAGSTVGGMPTTTTVYYVQVCDGTTCTSPDSSGGNTLYYENFAASSPATPVAGSPMFSLLRHKSPWHSLVTTDSMTGR